MTDHSKGPWRHNRKRIEPMDRPTSLSELVEAVFYGLVFMAFCLVAAAGLYTWWAL